ncbi:MAG: DNA polymerase III subunit beta [Patescibacteria group bacterium]|jgi:DNA polymerase-3 subunit beta|nr:DNA polymerase III subunit beta [bacterium]HQC50052.1 DNA polymerase III subunit beta [bacterium]
MKLICLQENLKRGLNIVGHATSKNINLPILNNILIKAQQGNIEFISTNLEIGVKHQVRGKIESEGEFTVDAKLITEYVNLLTSGEKVEIQEKENELRVESGNYKTKIKGESAKDYPLIPSISEENAYVCDFNELKKALASVVFAVSNNDNRVELTGVLFTFNKKNLSLAATDSYRLAEKNIKLKKGKEGEEEKVIVPAKTIQELLRIFNNFDLNQEAENLDQVKICLSDNQILFSFDSVSLISRIINGRYPDYKQIIPNKSQTEVLVNRQEMIRAIKAVSLFSKTGINDITAIFLKNKISLSAFSGSSGESQVDLEADVKGGDNEITINYRYLLDGFNNINTENVVIKVINNTTPCVLKPEKDDSYVYIVMPIRQ